MSKKVFVTGIAGFIGFHVAKALRKRGDEVLGIDNFNSYYSPKLKRERASLLQKEGIEILERDLNEFTLPPCSHVLHLAAQAGVRYARENPSSYVQSNLSGFVHLLEELKNKPAIPLIYASSSSVYGNNNSLPFSTEDSTDKPANLYAATKKANELLAYSYHHLYGLKTTALRYFTVYGPWGRPDMAYYSFTKAILEEKPLYLFNHGRMKRDFTYIDDIVNGTLKALDLSADYEIFNLGNHRSEELSYFISLLEEAVGKKAKLILEEEKKDEMVQTCADIEKSKKLLGFEPKTSLKEGLFTFVDWYRKHRDFQ